jgi:membrane protein implicated in regulation of membrane protease activity
MARSANALAWFSAILLVVGLLVLSPSAGFLLMILAAACALLPLAFGARAARVVSLVLLIAASVLAVKFYPEFRSDQRGVTERVKTHSTP